MTQTKEEGLPLMEDFSESNLLDQVQLHKQEDEELTDEEKVAVQAEEDRVAAEKAEKDEEEAANLALKEEEEEELTDEEKEAKAKKEEEEAAAEDTFWDDVDKITGNTYEIDYGDVEPDTPEGAALREEVVAKTAIEENLASLQESYPEAFEILQHVANGGKIGDLLSSGEVDYSAIEVTEDNKEAQKSFMKDFYMGKGFSEAKAIRNVEDDEDSEEGLFNSFQNALKEKQGIQETSKAAVVEKQLEAKKTQDAQDKQFGQSLSGLINSGKVGNLNVPKKEAEEFYKYVLGHTQRMGQGYGITIPISNDNFPKTLEQMFFGFKGGDLSKFVTSKAKTENAKKLRRNLKKEKDAGEGASEANRRKAGEKLPTMGAFSEGGE